MLLAKDANKLDGLNDCILGTTDEGYLVYCYKKLVLKHHHDMGMTEEEAIEYVDYNILGLGGKGVNWEFVFPLYDDLDWEFVNDLTE